MVDVAGFGVEASAHHSLDKHLVGNVQQQESVGFDARFCQSIRLIGGTGEENKSMGMPGRESFGFEKAI